MKLLNEKKAMELFMSGNIFGLEEIEKQIQKIKAEQEFELEYDINKIEEILQILNYAMKTNWLLIETEMEEYASDFNEKAKELDNIVLNKLFELLEIDIEYWWNRNEDIETYLGIIDNNNISYKQAVLKEYYILSKEYKNMEFCLNTDVNVYINIKKENIIKQTEYITVYRKEV